MKKIYYAVKLTIGKEEGFVAKESKSLLNSWMDACFFEDFEKAEEVAERAYAMAYDIYPRRRKSLGYIIVASKDYPREKNLIK